MNLKKKIKVFVQNISNPNFNKISIHYGILVFVCKFAHSIFLTTISLNRDYLWKTEKKWPFILWAVN